MNEELICLECNKIFFEKKKLNRHIDEIHSPNNEAYKYNCSKCDNRYKRKEHLTRHFNSIHLEKLFNCKLCILSYKSKDKLKNHYLKIHKKNYCNKCKNTYLNNHQCEVKIYSCKFCDKKYTKKFYYKNHKKEAHINRLNKEEQTNKKNQFILNKNLFNEIKLNYNKFYEENKILKFQKNTYFNEIIKIEKINKIFYCPNCLKKYKKKKYLERHFKNCKLNKN